MVFPPGLLLDNRWQFAGLQKFTKRGQFLFLVSAHLLDLGQGIVDFLGVLLVLLGEQLAQRFAVIITVLLADFPIDLARIMADVALLDFGNGRGKFLLHVSLLVTHILLLPGLGIFTAAVYPSGHTNSQKTEDHQCTQRTYVQSFHSISPDQNNAHQKWLQQRVENTRLERIPAGVPSKVPLILDPTEPAVRFIQFLPIEIIALPR